MYRLSQVYMTCECEREHERRDSTTARQHDSKHIRVGAASKDIAKAVADCHLQELVDILEKVAVKLGIDPEVSLIEEVLHMHPDRRREDRERNRRRVRGLRTAQLPGFGYRYNLNLAKLTMTPCEVGSV